MSDDRATVGVFLAGAALVAALVAWPATPFTGVIGITVPIMAGSGAALFLVFSARRHGRLSQQAAALGGVLGGTGLAIGGVLVFVTADPGMADRIASGIASVLGVGCVGIASAEYRDVPLDRFIQESQAVLIGAGLGFGGILTAGIIGTLPTVLPIDPSAVADFALSQAGVGIGLVTATVAFLMLTDRGRNYLDFAWPSRADLLLMAGGTVGIVLVAGVIQVGLGQLGIEFATHNVAERAREEGATLLLVAVGAAFLAQGLGEELLFRNGVQKFLTEEFTPLVAIVISSLIFASVHVSAYRGAFGSLLVVFTLSVLLGYLYYRSQNILVPIVIHGSYNAVMWLWLYVQLIG